MEVLKKIIDFLGSIQADKLLHLISGMLIAGMVGIIPCFANYAFIVAVVAGVAKEVYDEFSYGGWDSLDLLYTAIGAVVMQIFVWVL
jgi:hypothetical protein